MGAEQGGMGGAGGGVGRGWVVSGISDIVHVVAMRIQTISALSTAIPFSNSLGDLAIERGNKGVMLEEPLESPQAVMRHLPKKKYEQLLSLQD